MQRLLNHQRLVAQKAETLFQEPATDVIGHLSAHHPFPAALTEGYVHKLKALKLGSRFPAGSILFGQGEEPAGVYVVLEGHATLSVTSAGGKTLFLGLYGPGTILGLAAAVLNRPHAATAEILKPSEVLFVPRSELIREMRADVAAACRVAEFVSAVCYFLVSQMVAAELCSAEQKVARCLVGLLVENRSCSEALPVRLDLSQEAVAQIIGISRETVTRILSRLRAKRILSWRRSSLVISDRKMLERIANLNDEVALPPSLARTSRWPPVSVTDRRSV